MNLYIDEVEKETIGNNRYIIKYVYATENFYSKAKTRWSKKDMIAFMKANPHIGVKTKYKGLYLNIWMLGEDVKVIDGKYLRTDPNDKTCDNLGRL